ncbi:extracellular solute-binding protein [Paenibacillus ginsengarvi]|uniref:Extracellular solute-binding protein n=1 Tax=Paenibacillus ginsengarvi TaxID=400777 RepID=A0A3B0AVW5_9BACL|nr:extracellular solute-binding protein [Paenibacillus ginsengarvi]RKN64449.1 extracellular solute-binding protein [Paenibacillus ginsengarvi]
MSENRWPIFLLQNRVRFERKADGRYDLCTPLVKESLETCMGIVDKHFPSHLSENDGDVVSLFLRGKVSMVMASYSHLHAMKEAPFEYDIAPLPHLREVKTILVSIGLAVNKSSTRKAAAKRFVDYLLSYETQLHIRRHTLNLPSLRKAAEWVDAEGDNHTPYRFHMYRELIHTFRTYTDLNLTALELTAIRDEMRFYWSKLDDLDTVLERLEEKL